MNKKNHWWSYTIPQPHSYTGSESDGEILLDLNLEKKRHQPIAFSITKDAPELANIIKDSYNLYPREYVFTPKNIYPKLNKKPVRHH